MKSDKLLHVIGMIDESMIEEAAPITATTRPVRKCTWLRALMPVAACAAVTLFVIFALPRINKAPIDNTPVPGGGHSSIIPGQQSGAIYHGIDISQIIMHDYEAKVPIGFIFKHKLRMMRKDLSIGSHWDDQAQFTKKDIESALSISVTDPVLPEGDYTTTQAVLVDDAMDEIIAYRTDYYYFNKDTMEFQKRFSFFYFAEEHFNAEEIERMQNVTKTDSEIHIDDFVLPTNAHFKMPHVRKLLYLENSVSIVIEAEAGIVTTEGKIDQEKSLERYEQTDKQLIALINQFLSSAPTNR
ncbi:MAG: hypothetical protein PHZ11_09080 [Desulfitobacteriaceae bacterium]|nr:hypothetical protein [Desulfitobacteriaceae bacterium]MDD4347015.1 hypothetical protein [Desulfitobacteriaceae bacterium]MDD4402199.1 hypothetical protein [Desulfitobacteriaceae bacterium]